MNHSYSIFLTRIWMAAMMLALAGCSETLTDQLGEETGSDTPVTFFTSVLTKSMQSDLNVEGASIGVFADKQYDELEEPIPVFTNQQVSYSASQWRYAPLRYWDSNTEYHFYAYYPYDAEHVSFENGNLTITDYQASSQQDVMIAHPVTVAKGVKHAVQFQFRHLLTSVNVVLKISGEWGEAVTLTSLYLTGMKMGGTYAEKETAWTTIGNNYTGTDMGKSFENTTLTTTGTTYLSDLLMVPQEMNPTLKLILNYQSEGNNYSKEIVFMNKGITTPWQTGERITYTMTIAPNNIYFDRPQVSPWSSSTAGSGTIIL